MADLSVSAAIDALRDAPMNAPVAEDPNDIEGPIDDDDDDDDEDQDDAGDAGVDEGSEDSVEEDASDSDDDGEEGPEGATDDAETGEDTGDKGEQDKGPAIDPPVALALDDKGREFFKTLPRATQEWIVEHDKKLVADHTRKTQEVADKRKFYESRVEALKGVATEKEKRMAKWKQVDWVKLAGEVNPQKYQQTRAQFEKELGEYQDTRRKVETETAADLDRHDREQVTALKKLAPELLNGEEGKKARNAVIAAVIEAGIPKEYARKISAVEMVFVHKALKYDAYMAEKSKKPPITAKKDAKSSGRTITPSSRSSAPTGQRAAVQKVFNKAPTAANARRALANLPD